MQLYGVHKSFPELIQGLALLLVAAKLFWERLLARKAPPLPRRGEGRGEGLNSLVNVRAAA